MSHFVRCDRCNIEDAVTGTITLPPGWQKICGADLCEPCCMMVRDFIRFKPGDAERLPVEPIPEEVAPAATAKTELFETAPEVKPQSPVDTTAIAEEVAKVVNSGALDTPTCKVTMTVNPSEGQNADERARTRKGRRLRGQSVILPDPRNPNEPPPGVQP